MPSPPSSVLVVDDESSLRRTLCSSLAAIGFTVDEARSGEEAVASVRQRPFDLVILDINMPGGDGIDACRRIREHLPRIGIVMVTVRESEDDKVRALEAGADDYVTKPFRFGELTARLRAVLRRTGATMAEEQTPVFEAGDLKLDLERRLVWRGEEQIRLSPTEFELLAFLMKHSGMPLTHLRLLQAVWGTEYGGELEYLRSYIRMLRKKIEDDPRHPQFILTEPSVGYRFRNPADPDAILPPADELDF